jgi:hypothetical protein
MPPRPLFRSERGKIKPSQGMCQIGNFDNISFWSSRNRPHGIRERRRSYQQLRCGRQVFLDI